MRSGIIDHRLNQLEDNDLKSAELKAFDLGLGKSWNKLVT